MVPDTTDQEGGSSPKRHAPRVAVGVCAFLLVMAAVIWVISPRFAIRDLSLIDDWSAEDNAPRALSGLLHLAYSPRNISDPQRYRPGYTAVWNSLQWHTLGAPRSLAGPNAWNLLRLGVFTAALVAVPCAIAGWRRSALGIAVLTGLATLTPGLVVVTPALGQELAKFGPAEPLLTGGMIGGGSLMVLGLARVLVDRGGHVVSRWSRVWPFLVGYPVFLLGTYVKEISVCFLIIAPFLYLFLDRRWREAGYLHGPLWRQRPFQLVALLTLLPLAQMCLQVLKIARGGTTVYGGAVPLSLGGVVGRLSSSLVEQTRAAPDLLLIPSWSTLAVAVGVPLLLVVVIITRRRIPWLAIGLLVTGVATLVFQGLSGSGSAARYYIPVIALFGLAGVLLIAETHLAVGVTVTILGGAVVGLALPSARTNVETWASAEIDGNRAVDIAAALSGRGCRVYVAGLDGELADAFPELVALEHPPRNRGCNDFPGAFLLSRAHPELVDTVTDDRLFKACPDGGWRPSASTAYFRFRYCSHLTRRKVDGKEVSEIVVTDRLVPGERFAERNHVNTRLP